MLRLDDISVSYGEVEVFSRVSFVVPTGAVVILAGPNGSGKTTLLNAISGLGRLTKGRIVWAGIDITGVSGPRLTQLGISYVPQEANVFGALTVDENLRLAARLKGCPKGCKEIPHSMEFLSDLKALKPRLASSLSGGERQTLAIALALFGCPRLVLMDEPSAGLAEDRAKLLFSSLAQLSSVSSTSFLIAEQNLSIATQFSDKVVSL